MPVIVGDSNNNLRLEFGGLVYQNDNTLPSAAPYYTFSSIQFTPCGTYGRTGPSVSAMQTTYSAQTWTANISYLNSVSGIHKWLVPKTGTYTIQAAGAPGGRGSDTMSGVTTDGAGTYPPSNTQGTPGAGIIIQANFYLKGGDILYILVGQRGTDTASTAMNGSDTDGGGGGGTFVAKQVADSRYYFTPDSCYVYPLIVAGGGGGGSSDGNGAPGNYNNWQGNSNWQNVGSAGVGLGGGFSVNHRVNDINLPGYSIDSGFAAGATGNNGRRTGQSFLEGGIGGYGNYSGFAQFANGGFGGGAGATDEVGAGGGGWYGGLNGDNVATYSSQGGTSFIAPQGTSQSNVGYNSPSSASVQGYCTITFVA